MTSVRTALKQLKQDKDGEDEQDINMTIHLQKPVLQENIWKF